VGGELDQIIAGGEAGKRRYASVDAFIEKAVAMLCELVGDLRQPLLRVFALGAA
jgi:hypothetical protein